MIIEKKYNIFMDMGEGNIINILNNSEYDYNNYYFNNNIKIISDNDIININLKYLKYFKIKYYTISNYFLIYIYNKQYLIKTIILKSNDNNLYQINIRNNLIFKLNKIINIVKNKLNKNVLLKQEVIDNINNRLNIIKKDINIMCEQKIIYYIEILKFKFHI